MQNNNKVKKNMVLLKGEVETFLITIIALFGLLLTGYLTALNSSSFNNAPLPTASDWVYRTIPTKGLVQASYTLQENNIFYIAIPKGVLPLKGAPGGGKHAYGMKPNPKYYSPSAPIQFAMVHTHPSLALFLHIVGKVYADASAGDAHLA